MDNQYVDLSTLTYLLNEVHNIDSLFQTDRFKSYDRETIDIFLKSVKDLGDRECFPYTREMDLQPAYYEDGKIYIHPQFEKVLKQVAEMGLVGASFDEKYGGLQLPATVNSCVQFILNAANNNVSVYGGLTGGSANLIANFGSEELKQKYLPNMLSLKWGGTMCLTEPDAGSSLSDIVTSAKPLDDDTYKIEGQKIFISCGDHQFVDNIIHLVLARIEGAPAGTKGISLFVVPKFLENNGDLTYNHVGTLGEFEKLGQRGISTAHLGFSDGGDTIGWLVGEPNKGLKYMFLMMNEARLATGLTGAGIASAAYHSSLRYATERSQGRKLDATGTKDAETPPTKIINHPDVRRMLLFQKAVVEGSMSLLLEASHYLDKKETTEGEEKANYHLLLELLTPIAKTYPGEKGQESVNNGLQVLGGYGFTMDFDLQQYYRDIRIVTIYEGTTGIQSLDLLGRKVMMENGKALELLAAEIMKTISISESYDEIKPYAHELMKQLGTVRETVQALIPFALKGDYERFLADANVFMDLFSTVVVGWQWLKIATQAKQDLLSSNMTMPDSFYEGKIHTMKFFFKYEMSRVKGLSKTIMNTDDLTLSEVTEKYF